MGLNECSVQESFDDSGDVHSYNNKYGDLIWVLSGVRSGEPMVFGWEIFAGTGGYCGFLA